MPTDFKQIDLCILPRRVKAKRKRQINFDVYRHISCKRFEFFRIKFCRIYRICGILILVILKIETNNDSILQILKVL